MNSLTHCYEGVDQVDVTDSFLLELEWKGIEKLGDDPKYPKVEVEALKKYIKDKWTIFSNGEQFPYDD